MPHTWWHYWQSIRLIGCGFESCLGTIAQWPWENYLDLCASETKQYNLVSVKGRWCSWGWESDRRSGDALAMCHRLCCLSTYRLKAHVREMSTSPKLNFGHGQTPHSTFVNATTPTFNRTGYYRVGRKMLPTQHIYITVGHAWQGILRSSWRV